ncbi:MAG: FIST signal transduction protein [Candidatus Eiseniibacteriota bacterium]
MANTMLWASAVSERADARHAAMEAAGIVAERLNGAPPDVAFVFLSPHHRADAAAVSTAIAETLVPRHVVGCSARGIIGAGREIEERPGLSVTAARLPGVDVHTFRLDDRDLPDEDAAPRAWEAALGVPASEASGRTPHFVVLADPFSFSADRLLRGLDYAYPQSAKVGGLASASDKAGGNALLVDGDTLTAGCVGVALGGAIAVDTVVAQGCRAIGETMRVTRARQNFVLELDGKPPLEVLRGLVPQLSERDQKLVRTSLFLGVSADALTDTPRSGEYLIRNILGVSPDNGALAIGELPRVGQAVQFHLRDALASAEDLDQRIDHYVGGLETREGARAPAGALLFSCLGRGMHLYGRPDHDTDAFRERVGDIPLGGFFANGEIGPVHGVTYLHGFTSSFAVFRSP